MAIILGINISDLNREAVLKRADDFLAGDKNHYLVTPNPEIILEAHRDEEFFYVLNRADLSLADGIGVKIAAWIMNEKVHRITGADFTLDLLKNASRNKIKTLVLNWSKGLSSAEDITFALKKQFPDLDFVVIEIERDILLSDDILKKIKYFSPKLVFNTLGFPYQEKLMYHNLNRLESVRLMLGVGGSFDFISGKIKRSPRLLRQLGLEWFWRLLNANRYKNSSKRIKRIYNATYVFMIKVLRARFINPFLYRPNVACFLFKRIDGKIKILLVERRDEKNHWQLPQGGTDGEDLATAGKRELREETNATDLISVAVFPKLSRYDFTKRHLNPNNKDFKYDYKGQVQGLFIAEYKGEDKDIKVNFWDHQSWQWADIDNALNILHPVRQRAFKIFLEKFKSLNIN